MKSGKAVVRACRARVRQWRAERVCVAVEKAAQAVLNDYWRAVSDGARCEVLARAGCELAMSRLNPRDGLG